MINSQKCLEVYGDTVNYLALSNNGNIAEFNMANTTD